MIYIIMTLTHKKFHANQIYECSYFQNGQSGTVQEKTAAVNKIFDKYRGKRATHDFVSSLY